MFSLKGCGGLERNSLFLEVVMLHTALTEVTAPARIKLGTVICRRTILSCLK